MQKRRSLAAVFAHPDDDTWGLGGTYAASGDLDLTVVVATSGEAGLIADPALATRDNLAEVREAEERASLAAVGHDAAAIHFLRFPDGGVAQADRAELVARIADILRAARPDVVVTFGPDGTTKHDDHIAVSQAATQAFHEARGGSPAGRSGQGSGDAGLRRLFYVAIPQSELDGWFEMMRERGEEVDPDAPFMPRGVPDETITTRVDTSAHVDRKWAALQAHATQADEMEAMSDEERQMALATECFVRAWPPVTGRDEPVAGSLFQGLETAL
jgi:LmbE family N-acetylglucosaminyl deacetylase